MVELHRKMVEHGFGKDGFRRRQVRATADAEEPGSPLLTAEPDLSQRIAGRRLRAVSRNRAARGLSHRAGKARRRPRVLRPRVLPTGIRERRAWRPTSSQVNNSLSAEQGTLRGLHYQLVAPRRNKDGPLHSRQHLGLHPRPAARFADVRQMVRRRAVGRESQDDVRPQGLRTWIRRRSPTTPKPFTSSTSSTHRRPSGSCAGTIRSLRSIGLSSRRSFPTKMPPLPILHPAHHLGSRVTVENDAHSTNWRQLDDRLLVCSPTGRGRAITSSPHFTRDSADAYGDSLRARRVEMALKHVEPVFAIVDSETTAFLERLPRSASTCCAIMVPK